MPSKTAIAFGGLGINVVVCKQSFWSWNQCIALASRCVALILRTILHSTYVTLSAWNLCQLSLSGPIRILSQASHDRVSIGRLLRKIYLPSNIYSLESFHYIRPTVDSLNIARASWVPSLHPRRKILDYNSIPQPSTFWALNRTNLGHQNTQHPSIIKTHEVSTKL